MFTGKSWVKKMKGQKGGVKVLIKSRFALVPSTDALFSRSGQGRRHDSGSEKNFWSFRPSHRKLPTPLTWTIKFVLRPSLSFNGPTAFLKTTNPPQGRVCLSNILIPYFLRRFGCGGATWLGPSSPESAPRRSTVSFGPSCPYWKIKRSALTPSFSTR